MEANSRTLLHKSPEWAYEAEHRLIKPHRELILGTYNRNGTPIQGHYRSAAP